MTACTCLVQAGRISPAQRSTLHDKLQRLTGSNLDGPAEIRWIEVAPGSGYTAAKPSTSSIVAINAHAPLERAARTAMLHALCDLWVDTVGCTLDEIVAVISDPPPA